jgi:hypothetical protein
LLLLIIESVPRIVVNLSIATIVPDVDTLVAISQRGQIRSWWLPRLRRANQSTVFVDPSSTESIV